MKVAVSLALIVVASSFLQANAQDEFVDSPPCACFTPADIDYVCGSDGRTYINRATADCHATCGFAPVEVLKSGYCNTVRGSSCKCLKTFDINWICGSDGKSYINWSVLNCVETCGGEPVSVVASGICH